MGEEKKTGRGGEIRRGRLRKGEREGNLDGDGQARLEVAEINADLGEHQLTNLEDQNGLRGQRDEFRRQHQAMIRQFPAHQCFGANDCAGLDVVLWLVVDQEFIEFE